MMSWQSDWLYDLILREVERIWKQRPSRISALRVTEFSEGEFDDWLMCKNASRCWLYNQNGIQANDIDQLDDAQPKPNIGHVGFHISESRDLVIFFYALGPLHGRGNVFRVIGQGK